MADKKKTQTQDKKEMGVAELRKDLHAALEKRAKLAFQHNVAPIKNPLQLRDLRREIARLKTHLQMKEAAK